MDFFQVSIESLRDLIYFYIVRYLLKLNKPSWTFCRRDHTTYHISIPLVGNIIASFTSSKVGSPKKITIATMQITRGHGGGGNVPKG